MELILWRHAEAEDGFPDTARKLTEKGLKQAHNMAQWLKPRLPKNTRIMVSSAKRAQQTALALSNHFETTQEVGTSTTADRILAAANWPYEESSILVVGHQPTLGNVAASLICQNHAGFSIKKGAIWWFSYKQSADTENTILRAVISPDMV
ncbi:SixA phosphatase family protein [Nitrosomonas sp. Is37]|uniref:SixA phosphatase family protein n=1 Tax=Nitrosomonas sp. Is37 TaxID=3080535 RepID=UPI00294B875D|nr:histidine phosphatase family protein [Nitrosomonas sp. Is37]MDV6343242.1 histidine phosphatase family protein [Nitrosomonas sp. Is37]